MHGILTENRHCFFSTDDKGVSNVQEDGNIVGRYRRSAKTLYLTIKFLSQIKYYAYLQHSSIANAIKLISPKALLFTLIHAIRKLAVTI